jgi:hypothetical protein
MGQSMNHTIISDPLNVNITQFSQPTELRDKSGCVLGIFTPANRAASQEPEPELTLEQLRAIVAEPGGYSLQEIWRELGAK